MRCVSDLLLERGATVGDQEPVGRCVFLSPGGGCGRLEWAGAQQLQLWYHVHLIVVQVEVP